MTLGLLMHALQKRIVVHAANLRSGHGREAPAVAWSRSDKLCQTAGIATPGMRKINGGEG
jgi:hypothetical protein